MADGMSFDKYIDNPSGGQVFTNRQMYKAMYKSKFDNYNWNMVLWNNSNTECL